MSIIKKKIKNIVDLNLKLKIFFYFLLGNKWAINTQLLLMPKGCN